MINHGNHRFRVVSSPVHSLQLCSFAPRFAFIPAAQRVPISLNGLSRLPYPDLGALERPE